MGNIQKFWCTFGKALLQKVESKFRVHLQIVIPVIFRDMVTIIFVITPRLTFVTEMTPLIFALVRTSISRFLLIIIFTPNTTWL